MDFNKVNEANKAGENTPAASNINTDKQVIPPVEDGVDKQPANTVGFRDESLDEPYTEKRTITINLVTNYSLYRRVNDKTLPKRMDKIGTLVVEMAGYMQLLYGYWMKSLPMKHIARII